MTGIIVALFRHDDRADAAFFPAEAGAQQQVGIAGHEFQHFDEIDRQGQRHGAHDVVQKPFDIGLGQRPLAKLRERFLLLGAAAQFLLQPDPLGDVVADADHAPGAPSSKATGPDASIQQSSRSSRGATR